MSGEDGNISSGSSRNEWLDEFEDFCSSDDVLSLDELKRLTKEISLDDLRESSFLHQVCMNEKVTLEIVNYLLHLYPRTIHRCMDIFEGNNANVAYPLTFACLNEECPNEVIQLLLQRASNIRCQLTLKCHMDFDWGNTDMHCDTFGGTPLHYYLSRNYKSVDLDIVKQLLVNREALLLSDVDSKCTPIHIIMHNKSIGDMFDVLQYLVESNPSSLLVKDRNEETPLHIACGKSYTTARTIELLLRVCPNSIHERELNSLLPLHCLCLSEEEEEETKMNDEVAIGMLKLLLEAHPDSVTQTHDDGDLPLHMAASNKSPGFCRILVDAYPESVRRQDEYGCLPFYNACREGRSDTVEYLFEQYPESLHVRNNDGWLPIHGAAHFLRENATEIIKFLLLHDPECLSKPVVYTHQIGNINNGSLPLHLICSASWGPNRSNVTLFLFDLYPDAILIRNEREQLPVDVLREELDALSINNETGRPLNEDKYQRLQCTIRFLQTQMIYARQAQDENAMRTVDRAGSLPLHNALYGNAPLGSIKLLVKGNPDAIRAPDGIGILPLNIACEVSTAGVVKYLAELVLDRLNACDVNRNYPLHHACRGGNCEVITYLLETPMSSASVSERNTIDELPIHLFCKFVNEHEYEEDEKDTEYTETMWRLLMAYPETVLNW